MSDISELMSRDPLKLTKDDLKEVVNYFRGQRHLYMNNPGKVAAKAKAAPKLTASQQAAKKLDLGGFKL